MSIFDNVRQLDLRTVAEHYGLEAHGGMVNCIFHDDRNPSMKLYSDHFYCFGCGAHGDVTNLTAKLYDLTPIEAAKKLAADFGISTSEQKPSIIRKINTINAREEENRAFCILSDYCRYLRECKEKYAPKSPDEPLHPLFVESLTKISEYEYLIELLLQLDRENRQKLIAECKKMLSELE